MFFCSLRVQKSTENFKSFPSERLYGHLGWYGYGGKAQSLTLFVSRPQPETKEKLVRSFCLACHGHLVNNR